MTCGVSGLFGGLVLMLGAVGASGQCFVGGVFLGRILVLIW